MTEAPQMQDEDRPYFETVLSKALREGSSMCSALDHKDYYVSGLINLSMKSVRKKKAALAIAVCIRIEM